MARPQYPSRNKFLSVPSPIREPILITEARLNGGMNSYIDPADLLTSELQVAKNVRINADVIYPRPGTTALSVTKPNSNKILLYTLFTRFDKSGVYLRFDTSKIHRLGVSSWTEIEADSNAVTFSATNRVRFTTLNDKFFFSTGLDPIQEIDFSANTYDALGNAPSYKYIFGFFNRLVGLNLYHASNPNPVLVGWSGDLNFDEWDPLVDPSAGTNPLIESQSDYADPITGGFGFAAVALILRERSLWTVTKRPSASSPFQFQASFPSVGCDCPNTAVQKRNGIVWYDYRTNQVYDYTIGGTPTPIGDQIRKMLRARVTDKDLLQATYDPNNNRYHLLVTSSLTTTTSIFIFNFETGSWSYDERPNTYGVFALDRATVPLMIDDLVGMIDDLQGNIDDLTSTGVNPPNVYYGNTDGEILSEDDTVNTDGGVAIASELKSKIYTLPSSDVTVGRLLFKFLVVSTSTITLQFSRNNSTWETYKTVTLQPGRRIVVCPKQITSPEYSWRITSSTGRYEVQEYRIEGFATTQTRNK